MLEPTCVGRVRHVLGATVTVELNSDLAGVTPIWRGRLVPVGQVGSLVRIPQGPVSLLATVTLVGIAELTPPVPPAQSPQQGDRWLQVQLMGEIDALGQFHRGVTTYPGLDDPVHFTTAEDLRSVYPAASNSRVLFGAVASSPDVQVTLEAARLVTRHIALVGSTGAGKTSAVASLLQSFVEQGWNSANAIVVDPHGEYKSALTGTASIRSVLGEGDDLLRVPYWALPAADLLSVLCDLEGRTVVDRFSELITTARRTFAASANWLTIDPQEITADTPVPFDLREVWYILDRADQSTVTQKVGGDECVEDEGNAATLTSARFTPYGQGGAAPFKGPTYQHYTPAPDRLRLRLRDPRFRFFLEIPDPAQPDPLVSMVSQWIGGDKPVSVLDFSGVPADVADVAIGVVLQLLFELAVRSGNSGLGRDKPVLVVLEEAHRYLGEGGKARLARSATNRIAREGRKYGVGLALVTQRPSELPDTALSQCGTIVALRLTNGADQATIRSALPDAAVGLANILPSLRTGEALLSGEAVVLPTRTLVRRPNPEPKASDPLLDGWRGAKITDDELAASIARWRGGEAALD